MSTAADLRIRCWKFLIPPDEWREHPNAIPRLSFSGCAAIVLAETRERAVELLREAIGDPISWADVATVTEIALDAPLVALRVQT